MGKIESTKNLSKPSMDNNCLDVEYWRNLCPFLTISNYPNSSTAGATTVGATRTKTRVDVGVDRPPPPPTAAPKATKLNWKEFQQNGYSKYPAAQDKDISLDNLRKGLEILALNGWPPHFICVYDEPWRLIQRIQHDVMGNDHDFLFNGEFQCHFHGWDKDAIGFGPRRGGFVDSLNCLVSLSGDSQLMLIPRDKDPGYLKGDHPSIDPLISIISSKSSPKSSSKSIFVDDDYSGLQKISCLPLPLGSIVFYSHRLITWLPQSSSSSFEDGSASLLFQFTSSSLPTRQQPLLTHVSTDSPLPSFHQRLALGCAQSIRNVRRFRFMEKDRLPFYYGIFRKFMHLGFGTEFVDSVKDEFRWYGSFGGGEEDLFLSMAPAAVAKDSTLPPLPLPPLKQHGFGIFKDIFNNNGNNGNGKSTSKPASIVSSLNSSNCSSRLPSISSSPTNDHHAALDNSHSDNVEICECGNEIVPHHASSSSLSSSSRKKKVVLPGISTQQQPPTASLVSSDKSAKMAAFQSCVDTVEAVTEFFQHKKQPAKAISSLPPPPNNPPASSQISLSSSEERAKHLYSIFFNSDGTQKITGADLKHVVPIVCPDYGAVQRMAQGFYGNAKEIEGEGRMFGGIAVELIRGVGGFGSVPGDFWVVQGSSRRVGIKLKDNHLKSIGQALNIFLRESCYTYLLFFRTIIPTMVTHSTTTSSSKETFDQALYSRRIQQDFETTLNLLHALLPLGPLYADPMVDVVDTLLDAAREVGSLVLVSDACHIMSIIDLPIDKVKAWRVVLEGILSGGGGSSKSCDESTASGVSISKSTSRDEKSSGGSLSKSASSNDKSTSETAYDALLLKKTLDWCNAAIDQNSSSSSKPTWLCAAASLATSQNSDDNWQKYLDKLPQPCPGEMVDVLLRQLSDDTLGYKVAHISRLEVGDLEALEKVVESLHDCAVMSEDPTQLYAGVVIKLAYKFGDFSLEYTRNLLKKSGVKNRVRIQKKELFKKFLLRQCQKEFNRQETNTLTAQIASKTHQLHRLQQDQLKVEPSKVADAKESMTKLTTAEDEIDDLKRDFYMFRRRKIRNVRLVCWLIKMGTISPGLLVRCILPGLLFPPDSKEGVCGEVEVECAVLALRMTGRTLDKAYRRLMDEYFQKLKELLHAPPPVNIANGAVAPSAAVNGVAVGANGLSAITKADIEYLIRKRELGWRYLDEDDCYSTDDEQLLG